MTFFGFEGTKESRQPILMYSSTSETYRVRVVRKDKIMYLSWKSQATRLNGTEIRFSRWNYTKK